MFRLRNEFFVPAWRRIFGVGIVSLLALAGASALAQPANDNFATPTSLGSATSGSISDDNTGASAETNEPAHAGFPASSTLWYSWTAPQSGDVEVDTIGSSIDTVLAVYTGSTLTTLAQIAANDDLFPTAPTPGVGQIGQQNEYGQNSSTTNVPPGGIFDTNLVTLNLPPPVNTFLGNLYVFFQPYTGLPENAFVTGSGTSGLHFTAVGGV